MPNTTNNALMVFFKCHYCTAYVLYEYKYDVNPLEMYVTCVVNDFTRSQPDVVWGLSFILWILMNVCCEQLCAFCFSWSCDPGRAPDFLRPCCDIFF